MKLTIDQMTLICGFLEEMVEGVTDHAEDCPTRDGMGDCIYNDCQINGGDLVNATTFNIRELKKYIAAAKKAQPILTRTDNN